jgi:DNA repair photolyase
MVELLASERKSSVLVPSKLPCMGRMPTINLTAGCAHACLYCYAQGYCSYPGRGKVVVYANLLERLREDLARRRKKPEAVSFSPSSDLFQPVPEVLDLAWNVLELLFRQGIGVSFLTKGRIPGRHMDLLRAHAPLVRAQIGLITVDRRVVRILEPHTASPRVRLEQMRQLVDAGVATQARVDPIVPGLTDDPDAMHALCAALAAAGIREIAASTLFLRPALVGTLRKHLGRPMTFRRLMDAFKTGKWLQIASGQGAVLALSAARRRKIFDWLTTIAGQYGLAVRICVCKNPDMAIGSCNLSGRGSLPVVERQLPLFSG